MIPISQESLDYVDDLINRMPFRTLEMLEKEIQTWGAVLGKTESPNGLTYTDPKTNQVVILVPDCDSYLQNCYHRAHELGHFFAHHTPRMREEVLGGTWEEDKVEVEKLMKTMDAPNPFIASRSRDQDGPERYYGSLEEFDASLIAAHLLFPQRLLDQQILWNEHSGALIARAIVHYQLQDNGDDLTRMLWLIHLSFRWFGIRAWQVIRRARTSPDAWRAYCESQFLDPTKPHTFHDEDGKVYELNPVIGENID